MAQPTPVSRATYDPSDAPTLRDWGVECGIPLTITRSYNSLNAGKSMEGEMCRKSLSGKYTWQGSNLQPSVP